MKYSILTAILFGLVGLVVGYLLFARVNGHYIDPSYLFGNTDLLSKGILKLVGVDLEAIRTKIFVAGGVGLIVGAIAGKTRD